MMYEINPHHLTKDEITYELKIRGMPPQLTRNRFEALFERLQLEENGDIPRPGEMENYQENIDSCESDIGILEKQLINAVEHEDKNARSILSSRIAHIYYRIGRVIRTDEVMITRAFNLKEKIKQYLNMLLLDKEGKIKIQTKLHELLRLKNLGSSLENISEHEGQGAESLPLGMTSTEYRKSLLPLPADNIPKPTGAIKKTQFSFDNFCGVLDGGEKDEEFESSSLQDFNEYTPALRHEVIPKRLFANIVKGSVSPFCNSKPPVYNEPKHDTSSFLRRHFEELNIGTKKPVIDKSYAQTRLDFDENVNRRRNNYEYEVPRFEPRNIPRLNLNNRNEYNERPEVDFQRRVVHQQTRNFRNQIPGWKLTFNGQGNVNNFLTQVYHMARADKLEANDLLDSAIHLFVGNAREWYMAFSDSFNTWQDLVTALRREFISQDGDFYTLKQIEQKFQKKDEPFIVYLSGMVNLFNQLEEVVGPIRKAQLVKRNMLPHLARQLAVYNIQNLSDLSHYVKLIEDVEQATKETYFKKPVETNRPLNTNFRFNTQKREVNEIRTRGANIECRNTGEDNDPCWNCKEVGHMYTKCTYPKMRVFCYLCGELGQLATNCYLCRENGRPGPARIEERLDQPRM